jgi:glycosyltransferase involved in cell wall biosynthesis
MGDVSVSVVICTYNRAEMLVDAILSVGKQQIGGRFDWEIIVIDDGSTDNTGESAEETRRHISCPLRYIRTENSGIASARNRGLAEARGGWIAFFDDDQLAEPDWLLRLMEVAEQNGARCIGGTILADLPAEEKGRYGPVRLSMLGAHTLGTAPAPLKGRDVPSTGNLLIARDLLEACGGFDVARSSGEDTDLMLRLRQKGETLWAAPAAVVHHRTRHHRLQPDYFRWVAYRWGSQFAAIDAHCYGRFWLPLLAMARIMKCIFTCIPFLFMAKWRGDEARYMDCKCLAWRTMAYLRMTVYIAAPFLIRQNCFLEWIDFRKERSIFKEHLH